MELSDPRVAPGAWGGGMFPEQWYGTLTNGWTFYFRMRHSCAQLKVGPPGTPFRDMPLADPNFNWDEYMAAQDRGEEYPYTFFMEPIGRADVYDLDEDVGFFKDQVDRDTTFTNCLDQIWDRME